MHGLMELDEYHLDLVCVQHMGDQVRFSTRYLLEYCIVWRMRDGLRHEQMIPEARWDCLGGKELIL
jgi:hypothetical protein